MSSLVSRYPPVSLLLCTVPAFSLTPAASREPPPVVVVTPPGPSTKARITDLQTRPSVGFVVGRRQSLACQFLPIGPYPPENYAGEITTIELDIGNKRWRGDMGCVHADARRPVRYPLAGNYGGVTGDISLGIGAGANLLVGGSDRSVTLPHFRGRWHQDQPCGSRFQFWSCGWSDPVGLADRFDYTCCSFRGLVERSLVLGLKDKHVAQGLDRALGVAIEVGRGATVVRTCCIVAAHCGQPVIEANRIYILDHSRRLAEDTGAAEGTVMFKREAVKLKNLGTILT